MDKLLYFEADILYGGQPYTVFIMVGSVTKLILATNLPTKIAQIFCDFLAIFKIILFKAHLHYDENASFSH